MQQIPSLSGSRSAVEGEKRIEVKANIAPSRGVKHPKIGFGRTRTLTMSKKNKGKQKAQQQQQGRHRHDEAASPKIRIGNKKRRRSKGGEGWKHTNNLDNKKSQQTEKELQKEASINIVPFVLQWLEKRKIRIPEALLVDQNNLGVEDTDQLLRLLPSLRERERRGILRYVEKCIKNGQQNGDNNKTKSNDEELLQGSDGEYDIRDDDGDNNTVQSHGDTWPTKIQFSNDYRWDETVPKALKEKYSPTNNVRRRANRLSRKVYFQKITNPEHPAFGEYGLFCALPNGAPPGTWLVDYVGHVTLGEDEDKSSDYVSDFGSQSELACDANHYGNEGRFLNDFRNTGKHPNVEFKFRRDKNGELRQGIYVKYAKDSREKEFDGVKRHEELLVSYGKSYWRRRVGDLTDFVWRLPGKPMPEGRKPPSNNNAESWQEA